MNLETTLADYYETTFRKMRLNGRSEGTRRQYRINLRHFDKFLERPATLADLDDEIVSAAMGDMIDRGRSPTTANKFRNHLLALWRYAARKGHVGQFPDVQRLKEFKHLPTAWTAEQIATLVETAFRGRWLRKSRAHTSVCEIPSNLWFTGILLWTYDTGCRIGATLQVRVDDVNLDTGRALVRAETQKQHADQVFHLDRSTCAVLRQFAHVERALLFPWDRDPGMIYRDFREILKLAELPTTRRDLFHKIRRTAATMSELHVGRGTATALLGHSSANVTRGYVDTSMLPENHTAERLPRPVLVGVELPDGSLPAPETMLPAPFAAPVPINHSVAGIILTPAQTSAEADKLMDLDPFLLLPEYLEDFADAPARTQRYRKDCVSRITATFTALGVQTLRDLEPAKVVDFLERLRADRKLSAGRVEHYRYALWGFVVWLGRFRGIKGLSRLAEALNQKHDGLKRRRYHATAGKGGYR